VVRGERVCEEKEGFLKNIHEKWEEERDGEKENEMKREKEGEKDKESMK
jgi:hypothetical protein